MWQKNLSLIKWTDYTRRTISHHSQYLDNSPGFPTWSSWCVSTALPSPGYFLLFRALQQHELNLRSIRGKKISFTQIWILLCQETLCPSVGCTNSSSSFSMLLVNISPRGASEAKERTISVGSVLLVVPLGYFRASWPWCQNCPSLGCISSWPICAPQRVFASP